MSTRRNESFVTDAWREFLVEQAFTEAITLTFRQRQTTEGVKRCTEHWLRRCNRAFYGRNWFRSDGHELRFAFVIEIGEQGRPHAHVLLARPDRSLTEEERLWMAVIWFGKHGIIKLQEIYSPEGAAHYLTKTLADGGEIHLSRRKKAAR